MMNLPETVIILVVAFPVVVMPLTYVLGWVFSRGYHRGKLEFVHRLMTESIDGKE